MNPTARQDSIPYPVPNSLVGAVDHLRGEHRVDRERRLDRRRHGFDASLIVP
jgi:hypothetical protein